MKKREYVLNRSNMVEKRVSTVMEVFKNYTTKKGEVTNLKNNKQFCAALNEFIGNLD